jgi:drug/metabolite transporter (DMT)-like permease
MIKASHLHPVLLSAYRLLLSAALLSPLYARNLTKYRGEYSGRNLRLTFFPATMLAFHFITWTQGAQWTHAANATLIVCMVQIVMPFLLFFTIGEKITTAEIIGTLMALGGAVWLTASDFWVSSQTLFRDTTCFVSMLLFSIWRRRALTGTFPTAGCISCRCMPLQGRSVFFVTLFFAHPFALPPLREYLIVIGLTVILGDSEPCDEASARPDRERRQSLSISLRWCAGLFFVWQGSASRLLRRWRAGGRRRHRPHPPNGSHSRG